MYNNPWRVRLTNKEGKYQTITISTVEREDFKYETAVFYSIFNCGRLEIYDTKEEAIKGHEKYESMTEEELKKVKYIDYKGELE